MVNACSRTSPLFVSVCVCLCVHVHVAVRISTSVFASSCARFPACLCVCSGKGRVGGVGARPASGQVPAKPNQASKLSASRWSSPASVCREGFLSGPHLTPGRQTDVFTDLSAPSSAVHILCRRLYCKQRGKAGFPAKISPN